ncbi:hypothetical protein L218DRAFT_947272 [Marasmius fiardii PR-910]|nr:hypothetical protein L218DRAFT_947272 [Marasmius fiardii PR-910]
MSKLQLQYHERVNLTRILPGRRKLERPPPRSDEKESTKSRVKLRSAISGRYPPAKNETSIRKWALYARYRRQCTNVNRWVIHVGVEAAVAPPHKASANMTQGRQQSSKKHFLPGSREQDSSGHELPSRDRGIPTRETEMKTSEKLEDGEGKYGHFFTARKPVTLLKFSHYQAGARLTDPFQQVLQNWEFEP